MYHTHELCFGRNLRMVQVDVKVKDKILLVT